MLRATSLNQIEKRRRAVSGGLDKKTQSSLGQFFTPQPIASFMTSLFTNLDCPELTVLDPGAGIGSLSAAVLERTLKNFRGQCHLTAFEVDAGLIGELRKTVQIFQNLYEEEDRQLAATLRNEDFVVQGVQQAVSSHTDRYDCVILNPPYKKINSSSPHRQLLRRAGIETVNLYTAFIWLAVKLLKDQGQLVAIVPRSFCNGPYYRPFRKFLLSTVSIEHIHLFEARNKAFGDDNVLQENVILHVTKGKPQGPVTISTSQDARFTDYHDWSVPFDQVVKPMDQEAYIFIPYREGESVYIASDELYHSLTDIDCQVSTGPVVDFRVKQYLHQELAEDRAALIYPAHFNGWTVHHPVAMSKKSNTIDVNEATRKQLFPTGYYTLVRRFSAKEEKRRIVARVFRPEDVDSNLVGFENHLNVYHYNKQGLKEELAFGLATFLNSAVVDDYFRLFSGHTQVNATDLKHLKYPSHTNLCKLGRWAKKQKYFDLDEIDKRVRTIL
jgi:adenine-specific DNA-methyltransferase